MLTLETVYFLARFLKEKQWEERVDHYDNYITECPECSTSARQDRSGKTPALVHAEDCVLKAALTEVQALETAMEAKASAEEGDIDATDPVQKVAVEWAFRTAAIQAECTTAVNAAEQRAREAERKLAEFVSAAYDFGHADDRFRAILNSHKPR